MLINTKFRSEAPEIMDDFSMEGEILRDALDKIANINQLLGGNKLTVSGVKSLLLQQPKERLIRITDIGCGNGAMLRTLADFAKKHQLNFVLQGIDANAFTINHAKELTSGYPEISFKCADIFKEEIEDCEIILCTLTLHHFKDKEIIAILERFKRASKIGIVINVLHRSAIAYYLFNMICYVFGLNEMSRKDGLISILRGFKKQDLTRFSKQLNLKYCSINWRWAFRYEWLIKTS